jgi:hypothetical protein
MIPKLLPEDIEVLRMEPREREVRRPSLPHHCARVRTSTRTVHFISCNTCRVASSCGSSPNHDSSRSCSVPKRQSTRTHRRL